MIDIHCHIIPGVDDGAPSMQEALLMADMAASSGVRHIVATPHFRGEPESLQELDAIRRQFRRLQEAVAREGIPLTLSFGAEVLCLRETAAMAARKQLPTLNDSRYVLAEFYFDEPPAFMSEALHRIAASGYTPVVAHPERYVAVQQDPRLAGHWFRQGYILQLNKGSVLGAFGSRVEHTANHILADGAAHLIASDAHRADFRTPHMGELRRWVFAHCSPEYAEILLERNPRRITDGRPVVPV